MTDVDTKKIYLGDGAFVQIGSFRGEVVLTTEDGMAMLPSLPLGETNRVVLGPDEIRKLLLWLGERELDE